MKTPLRLILTGLLLIAGGSPAFAQRVLSSTTLASALDSTSQFMTVTSATGFTAPGTGSTFVVALIDRELVAVRSVNSTTIGIARGQQGITSAHVSGAAVWVGSPVGNFGSNIPAGQCIRTQLVSVPVIVAGVAGGGTDVGTIWDCLGLTTAGQYVQTNATGSSAAGTIGSTVSSATSVTPTGQYFKMSGTVNPVSTIVLPAGAAPGFQLLIEPTGAWVTDTAGNILIATTAVTGKLLTMTWNGAKWVPSY